MRAQFVICTDTIFTCCCCESIAFSVRPVKSIKKVPKLVKPEWYMRRLYKPMGLDPPRTLFLRDDPPRHSVQEAARKDECACAE